MLAAPGRDHGLDAMSTRSGFVALAGRPNVGKSTLVNSMVGHKVAIVSDKPQTTRRAIRGVVTAPDRFQLVLTDLPGVQRPRDALTAAHAAPRRVRARRGRRRAVRDQRRAGRRAGRPLHRRGAVRARRCRSSSPSTRSTGSTARAPCSRSRRRPTSGSSDAEVFPVSARTGRGVAAAGRPPRVGLLPEGPFYFPPDEVSDQPEHVHAGRAGARAGAATARARRSRTRSRSRSTRSTSRTSW